MCGGKPKTPDIPDPIDPAIAEQAAADTAAVEAETRRKKVFRGGRRSTILAGAIKAAQDSGVAKQKLGS